MKKLMYLFLSVIMCCSVFSGCFGVLSGAAATDFTVAKIFGDNMVLQCGKEVNVFGTASEGTTVTVTFAGQTKTAVADSNGAWIAKLDAMQADSEGKTLTVSNGVTEKSFSGVLVGEVWFASGQSNMAYTVSQVGNQNQYTDFDNYPNIRLVKIPNDTSAEYTWETPSSVKDALNNSAMAQAFALQLQKELNVPVGIVTAAVGGSWIEQWMDTSTASNNKSDTFKSLNISSSTFFESMVKPIIPFTFAGELWYQGEANCQEPAKYENQFKAYVQMIRGYFGYLPILTMQLPRYNGWEGQFFPEFRLSQQNLHDEENKLYTVGGIDFGHKSNIHPKDKVEFAKRAVNVALEFVYEKEVDSLSRLPVRIYAQGAETVVEYAQGTVLTPETVVDGFEILNNGEFKAVEGIIKGNTVVLSGTGDKVRYLYCPYPEKLIFDERGYALSPFRMDIDSRVYSINVNCGIGGSVAEYSANVKGGSSIHLVFLPEEGKQLVSVKVNGVERYIRGNVFELNYINDNINVEATFDNVKNIFSVLATSNYGGSVFVDKSNVESGGDVTVKVENKEGYKISRITVNGVKIKNTAEFVLSNVTENTTINVEFIKSSKGCTSSLNTTSILSVVCVISVALVLKKKNKLQER